jgi:RND family efflux transporter MFP subunit
MKRVALALAVVLSAGCHRAEPGETAAPVAVHCVSPKRESIEETVTLRGRLEPPPGGDLPVASQVAGRVVSVAVHEGQRIASGDLVASVDDAPSRDVLSQAEAGRAQARAAEVNADSTLERTRALVARGIAARQELEDAIAKADAARAAMNSANASTDLARRTLGKVLVRSSFAGIVTKVWRGPGALVDGTAGTPIVQLAAVQGVEFVADVTQRDLPLLREGQQARGSLLTGDAGFAGTVRTRSNALEATTGLGTALLTTVSEGSPMGAFGRVIVTAQRRDADLVIPSTAMRGAVADGSEVAICKDGKIEIRSIAVGWRDDQRAEVIGGLGANDKIATDHVLGLDNGTAIVEAK